MREAAGVDRISNLPDSLLHHIHSFLRIKDIARTSVPSKRWNFIWTTVPILEFANSLYNSIPTYPETQKFMDFVDGTLHRHDSSNIDKFSLHCNHHLNENRLHSWISTVIRANVKEIDLFIRQKRRLFIPLSLFTCESLISLKLLTYPNVRLPKYISFPRLKRLALICFGFSDESWNEELFSRSPVLEELILLSCTYSTRNFCISIPTLKLLKIGTWHDEENDLRNCVFKIDAPRLVSFSYWGYAAKEFVLSNFLVLVEATVYFNSQNKVGAEATSQLLGALAHVKCLTVHNETLKAICSAYDLSNYLPTFHNVKMLKISDSITTDEGLIALLKGVPNLESLVFGQYMNDKMVEDSVGEVENDSDEDDENDSDDAKGDGDNDNEDDAANSVEGEDNHHNKDEGAGDGDDDNEHDDAYFVEGENNYHNEYEGDVADAAECESNDEYEDNSWALDNATTGCLFPHLKSVCFQHFVGNPREMRWMKMILRNAKALQMMTIRYHAPSFYLVNTKSEEKLMVEMPSFPRASADCMINFC